MQASQRSCGARSGAIGAEDTDAVYITISSLRVRAEAVADEARKAKRTDSESVGVKKGEGLAGIMAAMANRRGIVT